ncbi:MAG: 2-C-methyl-D-erythritol 4-phosphate cytidylyltransferase [Oscillospiraceae bacterium]
MSSNLKQHAARPQTAAIIVAAGSSNRMGWDKLTAELGGKPVIWHTLTAFERCDAIDEIVLVAREERRSALSALIASCGFTKLHGVVVGGATRQQSVYAGACACSRESRLLCIHDGARPLVRDAVIRAALEAATTHGAATAAIPLKDTVKRVENGLVVETPDRATLFAIQTPQAFDRALYLRAYRAASADYSDDCQLIEAIGEPVVLSPGDAHNIKLTTPEDFLIAEAFLKERGAAV